MYRIKPCTQAEPVQSIFYAHPFWNGAPFEWHCHQNSASREWHCHRKSASREWHQCTGLVIAEFLPRQPHRSLLACFCVRNWPHHTISTNTLSPRKHRTDKTGCGALHLRMTASYDEHQYSYSLHIYWILRPVIWVLPFEKKDIMSKIEWVTVEDRMSNSPR
jgi:hypothetical protein